jgi:hypothetical protein
MLVEALIMASLLTAAKKWVIVYPWRSQIEGENWK